jgi:hypothetical protein
MKDKKFTMVEADGVGNDTKLIERLRRTRPEIFPLVSPRFIHGWPHAGPCDCAVVLVVGGERLT